MRRPQQAARIILSISSTSSDPKSQKYELLTTPYTSLFQLLFYEVRADTSFDFSIIIVIDHSQYCQHQLHEFWLPMLRGIPKKKFSYFKIQQAFPYRLDQVFKDLCLRLNPTLPYIFGHLPIGVGNNILIIACYPLQVLFQYIFPSSQFQLSL